MSEMIERVARAIVIANGGNPDEEVPATLGSAMMSFGHQPQWVIAVPLARAAIEAMREPTTEMANAGYNAGYGALDYLEPEAARSFWARAITAALGEPS